jgi:hypothetical protein
LPEAIIIYTEKCAHTAPGAEVVGSHLVP